MKKKSKTIQNKIHRVPLALQKKNKNKTESIKIKDIKNIYIHTCIHILYLTKKMMKKKTKKTNYEYENDYKMFVKGGIGRHIVWMDG